MAFLPYLILEVAVVTFLSVGVVDAVLFAEMVEHVRLMDEVGFVAALDWAHEFGHCGACMCSYSWSCERRLSRRKGVGMYENSSVCFTFTFTC